MATLNASNFDPTDDDEDVAAGVVALSQLTWHWRTWTKNIRVAVIVSAIALLMTGGIVVWLGQIDLDLSQKLGQQEGLKTQAQTKLRESGQERDSIVKHLPLLHDLEARNIFGEEKRLEWVEQLRIIEKHWPGVTIQYDISPQEILQPTKTSNIPAPAAIPTGAILPSGDPVKNFAVFDTKMKLTLQVLHEGDVFAILDELRKANLGLFTTKQCSFSRSGGSDTSGSATGFGNPLAVNCNLVWLSMRVYAGKL